MNTNSKKLAMKGRIIILQHVGLVLRHCNK